MFEQDIDVETFRDKLLPKWPPVFHRWFLRNFPEPNQWFEARLFYTRTLAVMSMARPHLVRSTDSFLQSFCMSGCDRSVRCWDSATATARTFSLTR
jgi:hypothetical protein